MSEHEMPTNGEAENNADGQPQNTWEQFFHHQRRALEETRKALETLLPPGFKEHSGEAGREFARGFRVLVDAAIDELKKISEHSEEEKGSDDDDDRPSTTGKTKVKVQVD